MSQTPEEIQADIERQREQLGATVDELSAKLDVKSKAQAKLAEVKDKATTDQGQPRPELIAGATGAVLLVALAVWWRKRS